MKDKALRVIKHYGARNQLKKIQEEFFEFTEAVIKYEENSGCDETTVKMNADNIFHIAEETADVIFMLIQFIQYYGIEEEVERFIKLKSDRQLSRIRKEKISLHK